MEILQNLFDRLIEEQLKSELALTRIVSRKFKEHGVTLTVAQEMGILKQFEAGDFEKLQIELTEEQERQLNPNGNKGLYTLELGEEDADSYIATITEAITGTLVELPSTLGATLLEGFKEEAREVLRLEALDEQAYQALIQERWEKPLTLLKMLLSICLEAGSCFNEEYRPQAIEQNDIVFEALIRLHARGCQVGSEILTLLAHGFAEGAYARWRTLHEITVTANFISNHGDEVAERYLNHRTISDYKDAKDHQRYCRTLGWEPIPKEELDALKAAHDSLVVDYGKSFANRYGWAAQVLKKEDPSFLQIEEQVGLAHARPFYLIGNLSVHASSKSVLFRLGSPPEGDEILVAGPSFYGLSEPGQATAWTINQLTGTLLLIKPNLDRLALISATSLLVNEIYAAFSRAEADLKLPNLNFPESLST